MGGISKEDSKKVLTNWKLHKVGLLKDLDLHIIMFLAKVDFGSVLGSEVFGSEILDQGVLGADSEHTEHALLLLLPGVAHQAGVGGVQ